MTEEKSIPWREVLERAKARGHFTDDDKWRARLWNTCAVGERLGAELYKWSFELAPDLRALGLRFAYALVNDDVTRAEELLAEIEAFPAA